MNHEILILHTALPSLFLWHFQAFYRGGKACFYGYLSDSICRKDSSMTTQRLLSNKNLQAHIIVTEFSRPDSSGKQYPVKTTEIELNSQESELSDKQSVSGSEGLQIKNMDLSNQSEERVKEDVKRDNRPVPVWVWWFLIIGGVISALLTWYAQKKIVFSWY